jgi:hypothetical protein
MRMWMKLIQEGTVGPNRISVDTEMKKQRFADRAIMLFFCVVCFIGKLNDSDV